MSLFAVAATIAIGSPEALAHEAVSAPAAPADLIYVVKPGDYLAGIAAAHGVKLSELLVLNNITATTAVHPGDNLRIPADGVVPPDTSSPGLTGTYVVKPGDFLIDIAAKNGVTLKALLSANGLVASSVIVPGRRLALPPATLPLAPPIAPVPPSAPDAPSSVAAPASMQTVVAFLQAQLGKPYEFNKAGPDSYDCSGLVRAAYLQIGISLPHQSLLQSRIGAPVDWHIDDIRAGDLVFAFSTGKNYISHVGVAISSTQWISSSQTGIPVRIGRLPADARIQAVRRVVSD